MLDDVWLLGGTSALSQPKFRGAWSSASLAMDFGVTPRPCCGKTVPPGDPTIKLRHSACLLLVKTGWKPVPHLPLLAQGALKNLCTEEYSLI